MDFDAVVTTFGLPGGITLAMWWIWVTNRKDAPAKNDAATQISAGLEDMKRDIQRNTDRIEAIGDRLARLEGKIEGRMG